jgi:hypothetical protein
MNNGGNKSYMNTMVHRIAKDYSIHIVNPKVLENVMEIPRGWTNTKQLETCKYQKWQQELSLHYQED